MKDEKINDYKVTEKIKILSYRGEGMELLIERYASHDNLSIWYKGKELYGMHFTSDYMSIFPNNPRAVKYVRIPSRGTQIIVKGANQ